MENEILNQILSELKDLRAGQDKFETSLGSLSGEVQGLSGEVQSLSGQFQVLSGEVQVLSEQFQVLSGEVQVLSEQVQVLSGEVQEIKEEVQEIKERVVLIENDFGKDIKALHDGYALVYDICQEIREDVHRLQTRQDVQDSQISLLSSEKYRNNNAV